jgi:hypothetical protein
MTAKELDLTADFFAKLTARLNLASWFPSAVACAVSWVLVMSQAIGLQSFGGRDAWKAHKELTTIARLGDRVAALTLTNVAAVVALTVVASLMISPFQFALLQAFEGYEGVAPIRPFLRQGVRRHELRLKRLAQLENEGGTTNSHRAESAKWRHRHYITGDTSIDLSRKVTPMPTTFGNALRQGETRAGSRFNIDVIKAIPRMLHHLDAHSRQTLDASRSSMELGINLSTAMTAMAVVSTPVLANDGWAAGSIPIGLFALGYAAYRGAIAAADLYVEMLAVTIDLHRFKLLEDAHLALPSSREDEKNTFGFLCETFKRSGDLPLPAGKHYVHPARRKA